MITACIPSPPADLEELYSRISLHTVSRSCSLTGSAAPGVRMLAGASLSLHSRWYLRPVHSSGLRPGVADLMIVRLDFLKLLKSLTAEHTL